MNLHDHAKISGSLTYRIYKCVPGMPRVLIETVTEHNLVVNQGRNLLANLIAGKSDHYVKYLQVGEGTTPAQLTDTRLLGTVAHVEMYETTVVNNDAIFKWRLGTGDANNIKITEFALLDNFQNMVTHQVRGKVFEKAQDCIIEGTYTLHF